MSAPRARLEKLSEQTPLWSFESGDDDHDDFLRTQALEDQSAGRSITLVWGVPDSSIQAYATVSPCSLSDTITGLTLTRLAPADPVFADIGVLDDCAEAVTTHMLRVAEVARLTVLLAVASQVTNPGLFVLGLGFEEISGTDYLWRSVASTRRSTSRQARAL